MDDAVVKDEDKEEEEEDIDVDIEELKKAEKKSGKKDIGVPKVFDVLVPNIGDALLDDDIETPLLTDDDPLADVTDNFAEDDDELTDDYFSGGADPDTEDVPF